MKKDRIIKYSLICFCLIFIVIQLFHYNKNYNEISEKASEEWGKSIKLSETYLKSKPSLMNNKKNVFVAFSTEKGVRFTLLDRNGKIIREKEYDLGRYMENMTFIEKNEEIYFYWMGYKKGIKSLNGIKLDNMLNYDEALKIDDISSFTKISDNEIIANTKSGILVVDENLNIISKIHMEYTEKLDAIKIEDKIYIAYFKDMKFYLATVENGKVIENKEIYKKRMSGESEIKGILMDVNNSDISITYQFFVKGVYQGTSVVVCSLNHNRTFNKKLKGISKVNRVNVGEGFVSYTKYLRNGRFENQDIVRFNIINGNIKDKIYVSNTRSKSLYPDVNGDYAVFGDYKQGNTFEMRLNILNGKYDVEDAYIDKTYIIMTTIQGMIFAILYLFTFGLIWLGPMIFISGITSFTLTSMDEKRNKKLYIINLIIVGVIQIFNLYKVFYLKSSRINDNFLSMPLGMGLIIILFSLASYIGYKIYEEDTDVVMTLVLGGTIMMESIMVFAIFGQYLG